jgi:hypothetical protein
MIHIGFVFASDGALLDRLLNLTNAILIRHNFSFQLRDLLYEERAAGTKETLHQVVARTIPIGPRFIFNEF